MSAVNDPLIDAVESFRQRNAADRTSEALEWEVLRPCWSQFVRIAHFLASQGVLGSLIGGDDDLIMSFVMEATWELLCSPIPSVALPVDATSSGFVPIMRRRVAQMARAHATAHPVSGLAGTAAITKRRAAVAAHSRRLAKTLGYTPDLDDAMDSYNEYLLATRKDARKQGALVTHANMALASVRVTGAVHGLTTDDEPTVHAGASHDDAAIADVDLGLLSAEIQRRADDHSALTGQVAFELLDLAASGDGPPQASAMAKTLGADRLDVQDAIAEVQQITIEVLDRTARERSERAGSVS